MSSCESRRARINRPSLDQSIAQFAAWALARAQKTSIDILDDDQISVISSSSSSSSSDDEQPSPSSEQIKPAISKTISSPNLPPFKSHLIRQLITRHGEISDLPPPSELPGCTMPRELVGVVKVGTVRKWLEHKRRWDSKFAKTKARVHQQRIKDIQEGGYEVFGEGEVPPPSALAGRRRKVPAAEKKDRRKGKSWGLAVWSGWGSKHDKATKRREDKAEGDEERKDDRENKMVQRGVEKAVVEGGNESETGGHGAREWDELQGQEGVDGGGIRGVPGKAKLKAWRRWVKDEKQIPDEKVEEVGADVKPAGVMLPENGEAVVLSKSEEKLVEEEGKKQKEEEGEGENNEVQGEEKGEDQEQGNGFDFLSPPDDSKGVSGKRLFLGGLATPFSLKKEAETASMITLQSPKDLDGRSIRYSIADSASNLAVSMAEKGQAGEGAEAEDKKVADEEGEDNDERRDVYPEGDLPPTPSVLLPTPSFVTVLTPGASRPELDRFVTADEIPRSG